MADRVPLRRTAVVGVTMVLALAAALALAATDACGRSVVAPARTGSLEAEQTRR